MSDIEAKIDHEDVAVNHEVNDLIRNKVCGDFVNSNTYRPVFISSQSDVYQAADVLAKNGITSAPVIDEDANHIQGIFDYDDLAALVLAAFQKDPVQNVELTEEHMDLAKFLLDSHASYLGNAPVKNVVDLSKNKPAVVIRDNAPLSTAIKHFKKGKRRCIIVNDAEKFIGVLSQSDVIKFIHKEMIAFEKTARLSGEFQESHYSGVLNQTLEELNVARKEVATINENSSVFQALQEMYRLNFSGIAIVNSSGAITGSISEKDLKFAFQMQWLQILNHSCRQYVSSARRQNSLKERGGMDSAPVISVSPNSKLGMVIESLVATKIHRIWVVENRKPVGIISLADVIRIICS